MGMLILTRKIGEALVINNNVTVKVLSVKGGQVKLGVSAPKDVKVNREEVQNKINGDNNSTTSDSESLNE